jgi:hypothetical protein
MGSSRGSPWQSSNPGFNLACLSDIDLIEALSLGIIESTLQTFRGQRHRGKAQGTLAKQEEYWQYQVL